MGYGQVNIPAQLGRLQERFERWRRTHAVRSRLPDELWAAAVEMTRICGLNRTVKTLKLDYYALKKRVESSPKKRGKRQATRGVDLSGGIRFVELANSSQTGIPGPGGCECCVEWEDAAGCLCFGIERRRR